MTYSKKFLRKNTVSAFFAALAIILLFTAAVTAAPDISNIVFTPGRTESELNFAWQTPMDTSADAAVQVAAASDMTDANFPEDRAQTFTGKATNSGSGFTSHKVTMSGLAPSTNYIYRIGAGRTGEWSDVYRFSTQNAENYSFILMGDAQIGAKRIDDDTAGLRDTMEKALQTAPDAAFILSVGDQVDSSKQEEYDGLLSLPQFKNLPFVPTIGNHDNNSLFSRHFNVPDENLTLGRTAAGGNYCFVYGSSLYMVINSNNRNYEQHKAFVRDAVRKHPAARWRIAVMHHSIYGADVPRSETLDFRKNLVPVFDRYGIDVTLFGHDHIYLRSHFMMNDEVVRPLTESSARPQAELPAEIPAGAVIKPEGTLYLMSASSSGSKYYDPASKRFEYIAERAAPYVPMFSRINITNTSFEIVSYRTDDMSVVDSFVMVKPAFEGNRRNYIATALMISLVFGVALSVALSVFAVVSKKKKASRTRLFH